MPYSCSTCNEEHPTGFVCKKPKHYFNKLQPLDRKALESCFDVFDEIKYRGYKQESKCEFMIPVEQRDKIITRILSKLGK